MIFLDRTGKRYGKLVVIKLAGRNKHDQFMWKCKCDCGKDAIVRGDHLSSGRQISCGCSTIRYGAANYKFKHGRSTTPEYKSWCHMKQRCYNRNNRSFPGYGGRGILVCERWRDSFSNFLADMGNRPSPSHTLDRKDNNLGYSPENCRWATKLEQANNRRPRSCRVLPKAA